PGSADRRGRRHRGGDRVVGRPRGRTGRSAGTAGPMKLLVVEDDSRMAELLRRGLSRDGSAVTVATTVLQAQDEVLAGHFDVAVCDVMLPDASGLELCRWIREQRVWVPVLLLTARTAVGDRVAGLDSGA